jgi:hypothetical protein
MYLQYPDALGEELEILFQPYDDAMYAVLHNRMIDKITELMNRRALCRNPATGKPAKGELVFPPDVKRELAKALAKAVLHQARPEAIDGKV